LPGVQRWGPWCSGCCLHGLRQVVYSRKITEAISR
jgi:hypothetical protein